MASKVQDLTVSEKRLRKPLKDPLLYKKNIVEELYTLKDELVDTFYFYFEKANEPVFFLYP